MGCSLTSCLSDDAIPRYEFKQVKPFIPNVKKGRVIKVYDGDTITVAARESGRKTINRFSVRLRGIDCPEIRGSSIEERKVANLARLYVESQCYYKMVRLDNVGLDKYGRLLADVILPNGINVSHELLKQRLAVSYDGRSKRSPANWLRYLEKNKID